VPSSSRPSGTSRALVLWGPVGLYALAIFIESSISQVPALPSGFTDKDGHGLLYAGLAVLVLRAASGARWEGVTLRAAAAAVAFAAVYGITDEFHQWFVPGRAADVNDWVADCTGAAAAVAVVVLIARFAKKRRDHRFHR
jgi:VanZ family protein